MDSGLILILVVAAVAFAGFLYWNKRRGAESRATELSRRNQEMLGFVLAVNTNRNFLAVDSSGIALTDGELCILNESADRMEVKKHRSSTGASVRVVKGLWVGGRNYHSRESLDVTDSGRIYITNKRIAFIGFKKTVNTPLKDIVSHKGHWDALSINSSKRDAVTIIAFDKAYLGNLILGMLTDQWTWPLRPEQVVSATIDGSSISVECLP
jgi:hypothetical protein